MLGPDRREGRMASELLAAVFGCIGAVVGAGGTYAATRRDTIAQVAESRSDLTQREGQGRREEWGRRFTAALEDIADEDFRRRELGRAVLVYLAKSPLAGPDDRHLADVVLDASARLENDGDVLLIPEGLVMDSTRFVEDDGDGATEGADDG